MNFRLRNVSKGLPTMSQKSVYKSFASGVIPKSNNLLEKKFVKIYTHDPMITYRVDIVSKARQQQSNRLKTKVMLTVFFVYRGVVHCDFQPGQTVYKEGLRKVIRKKRPDLWKDKLWFSHQHNAPHHTPLIIFLFTNIVPQPPFSLDFWLFWDHRFETIEEIQRESLCTLKTISRNNLLTRSDMET